MSKQAQAQSATAGIGNWFANMPPEQRTALIGAILGGGALGTYQAMTPDRQDPRTGKKRKKGVVSKALLGAVLGGAAGAGLGYAGKHLDVAPAADTGRKAPLLSRAAQWAVPTAGVGAGGVGAWKWYKPNVATQASLLDKLEQAYRDPASKMDETKYLKNKAFIINETRKGGVLEFLASRRARINARERLAREPFTIHTNPLPQPPRGMDRVKDILHGIGRGVRDPRKALRAIGRGVRSPAGVLIGGPLAGGVLGEVGRRTIWSNDLDRMAPTAAANANEVSLRRLEGKQ